MSDKQTSRRKSGLGSMPLNPPPPDNLFSPTDLPVQKKEEVEATPPVEEAPDEKVVDIVRPRKGAKTAPTKQGTPSAPQFLAGVEGSDKEAIGLQVTTEINDWLDEVVKASRRKNGKKLKKQVIIQAGVELLRAMPVDWTDIGDLNELRGKLEELSAFAYKDRK